MRRLTLFAKGNADVRDSLLYLKRGDDLLWNGVHALVRERFPDVTVRVRHETWNRSDALLAASGTPPEELAEAGLPMFNHPLKSQFSRVLFETPADAYVLSILPDLFSYLARHRRDGHLFMPVAVNEYTPEQRDWLKAHCDLSALLDAAASMRNLEEIVARLRQVTSAPILVYNCSACVAGNDVFCHQGKETILSTRIREFNLGLVKLSQRTGIAVVDVDLLFAKHGVANMAVDQTHMTAEGCAVVAGEVIRIMEACGLFSGMERAA